VRGNGKLMSWTGEESKARRGILVDEETHAFIQVTSNSKLEASTFTCDLSTFQREKG
jgi:hypothetical protein